MPASFITSPRLQRKCISKIRCVSVSFSVAGPMYMRDRRAFDLKWLMVAYNLFQVIFSSLLFYGALSAGWWPYLGGDGVGKKASYSFVCQPVDYTYSPRAILMSRVSYWFYVGKFIEFFDTFFFVLRKKFGQVSFLHVFHHAIMPLYMWPSVRYMPGGHGTFAGLLNSFVHIFMYAYYLLSALGLRKLLFWKQGLTVMQMVQFVLALVHSAQLLVVSSCGYPVEYAYFNIGLMLIFLGLFGHFYVNEYLEKKEKNVVKKIKMR